MQPRVSSIFGSYDLFAKAFPGIVFFSLAVSLLPVPAVSGKVQSNGILLAVITLSVIIFGFVSGQALHAIAVRIENIVLRTAESYISYRKTAYILVVSMFKLIKYHIIRIAGRNKSNAEDTSEGGESNDGEGTPKEEYISKKKEEYDTKRFLKEWFSLLTYTFLSFSPFILIAIYIWIGEVGAAVFTVFLILFPPRNTKDWLKDTLYPHRELFDDKMESNEQSVIKFKAYLKELFDITPQENSEFAYKIVMSYYERITVGRTRQFQATFSFCRSMWVTLLLFSAIFLFISSPTLSELMPLTEYNTIFNWSYTPIIELVLPNQSIFNAVGFLMLLSVPLFIEGERQNKRLFVEYIFIDLLTISENQLPEDIQSKS